MKVEKILLVIIDIKRYFMSETFSPQMKKKMLSQIEEEQKQLKLRKAKLAEKKFAKEKFLKDSNKD
jgi:hypothetical protein